MSHCACIIFGNEECISVFIVFSKFNLNIGYLKPTLIACTKFSDFE